MSDKIKQVPHSLTSWKSFVLHFFWLLFVYCIASKSRSEFIGMGGDFDVYYAVGELFKTGYQNQIYNGTEIAPFYGYSPTAAPLFYALTFLPWKVCKVVFFSLKIFLFFLWPYFLSFFLPGPRNLNLKILFSGVLSCCVVSPAVFEDLVAGNLNTFFVTFLMLSAKCLKEAKTCTAAILLTPIAVLKPHYGIFALPFLLHDFRKYTLTAASILIGIFLYSLLFFSPIELRDHFITWINYIKNPIAGPADVNNMAWFALITRLTTDLQLGQANGHPSIHLGLLSSETLGSVVTLLKIIFAVTGLGSLYFSIKAHFTTKNPYVNILVFATSAMLMLTLSPLVWMTYFVLLIFPVYYFTLKLFEQPRFILGTFILALSISIYIPGGFLQKSEPLRVIGRAYAIPQYFTFFVTFIVAFKAWTIWKNRGLKYE